MSSPKRVPLLFSAVVLLVVAVAVILLDRSGGAEAHPAVQGDVAESVEGIEPSELPERAAGFLATERPWRAATVMRSYLAGVDDAPAEYRLLAARAEAGWGAWAAALELLEGVPALDTHENGIGLYLLARARGEAGDPVGAVEAYRAFLALSPAAGEMEEERRAAELRLGLALIRAGEREAGEAQLRAVSSRAGDVASWIALLRADALAEVGDTAAVRAAVAGTDDGLEGLRAWRSRIRAAERAGDLAGARELAQRARRWASTRTTQAEFLVREGRIVTAMGEQAAGRGLMRQAIALGNAGTYARQAADALRQGERSPDDDLAIARVDAAQGLHEQAVAGFRRWLEAGRGSASERGEVHMEHATALFYSNRFDEVAAALSPISGETSAQFLRARAASHAGEIEEAMRLYLSLAERHAGNANGRSALFTAAGIRHDENDVARARELYGRVIDRYAGSDHMGLAMMRLAGIAFHREEYAEAARIWDEYLRRYPRGSRAEQSMYWSARAREAMGDSSGAASLYRSAMQRERGGYYALLSAERLGESFWPLPMRSAPAADAAAAERVARWMDGVDLLREAGFPEEASAQADRAVTRAGSDRATLYALAEALAERGYSRAAIRIGLRLQGSGQADRRLLRILYPFPYRTLITEEARDRGFDPFVAAALIRQESMFEARITSPAGARGLMQVMPATGARLAEAAGVEDWDAEMLYHPEINVHLGTRYVARHLEEYDGSLPSVFSAYNAGAHRVEWWSDFAEYDDDLLFTERIPYRETRDYVKILTRNRAIYAGLYGGE